MTNVTLSIDEENLRQARVLALQQGTSLNAVIRAFIEDYIGNDKRNQQVTRQILQQTRQSQYDSGGRKWTREAVHER